MSKNKNKTTNTLPSGAPKDGGEDVRGAAEAAEAPAGDTVPQASPELAELSARVDAAEERAAKAEERARAAEEAVGKIAEGGGASRVVSAEIKKRENLNAANRMIRHAAKAGLKSRMGKKPEDMRLVIFRTPWKRGIYQPDGKAHGFNPKLAAKIVGSGVAHYASEEQVEAIQRARFEHQAESIARQRALVGD